MSESADQDGMDWSRSSTPSTDDSGTASMMDGASDTQADQGWGTVSEFPQVAAIFVHAGAGYHSTNNERYHLLACDKASRAAMNVLKNGGSAVAGVEAAIKVLEDTDVTNAGFGSNLTIDGVVEADATIVDHLGRSGACGATSKIRNPISLARTILEGTSKELSLRRVPPNLLVGQGATDYGYEHGIPVMPLDANISDNSRDRWLRWQEELRKANISHPSSTSSSPAKEYFTSQNLACEDRLINDQRRDHTNALLTATWNEGQPDSPQPSSPHVEHSPNESFQVQNPMPRFGDISPRSSRSDSPERVTMVRPSVTTPSAPHRHSPLRGTTLLTGSPTAQLRQYAAGFEADMVIGKGDGPTEQGEIDGSCSPNPHAKTRQHPSSSQFDAIKSEQSLDNSPDDLITDTVGAIAIDQYGRIAAGSSSGGIGMKHRGRVGPAALVGIGTAVVPESSMDDEATSVATCTSGTGEHMATTMAAQKCADRLYDLTKRTIGGSHVDITEEEALSHFVKTDFMGHPGVKWSRSPGAIGVMAVKKSVYGYFLYFAHNTESFALASMHSNEARPKCVMSRLGETRTESSVVQGGRKISIR